MISWGVIDNWGWIWSVIYIYDMVLYEKRVDLYNVELWTKYLFLSLVNIHGSYISSIFTGDTSQQSWTCNLFYNYSESVLEVQWLHNGSVITTDTSPSVTWTLNSNQLNNSGTYTCHGYENGHYCGNKSRTFTVIGK